MDDKDFREITDYLEEQKKLGEQTDIVAKMLADIFNALVEHGVPEQYAVGMTMSYFWTMAQRS